jgi:hypothetical protein
MATYTAAQMTGQGVLGENLSGTKTFTFTNPSGSAYFTLETVRQPNGFILDLLLLTFQVHGLCLNQ